jgi:putative membrane-bound dehydrogenase-like protein
MGRRFIAVVVASLACVASGSPEQAKGFPEARNAAMAPGDTAKAMKVPADFSVGVFASEPEIHQPIAMAWDDRGRLWVAEMYSYPDWAREGNDRILILEDTRHEGKADKVTVFYDKLNCVTGLAVGFGGVWVGSNPDLLFIPFKDGDDKPSGPPQVLLDGWGHNDMHELLNSFTWGPDGWLYGCHGIFTSSEVGKPGSPREARVKINAGVWRFHPTRHDFEVFAEGTSNPWGIDFNDRGQAFITACVIPHLYHIIQGARYERQAGRHYNPYTYDDLKTIADHRHWAGANWADSRGGQGDHSAAGGGHAHAGAMIYLGGLLPGEYRDTLFMCNIHGNRVNNDLLERSGSGYVGRHRKDFLLSGDEWFRGLALKYGPEGAVYVSDWYDKFACHQQRPADRTNGRVYRVTYKDAKPVAVDLSRLKNVELVRLQLHQNDWYVRQARRILQERGPDPEVHAALSKLLADSPDETRKLRALWALHGAAGLTEAIALEQLSSPFEFVRAWTVQLLAERRDVSAAALGRLESMAREDGSPVVRLYLASALQRLPFEKRWGILEGLAGHDADAADPNLSLLVWYALEPLVASDSGRALAFVPKCRLPRVVQYIARRATAK